MMLRGDRLKRLREQRGYTHAELASLLDIGYAQVNRYEAGKVDPSADVLGRMANVFGVSTDYLLGRTNDPTPDLTALSDAEKEAISAWRQGDIRAAIAVIVNH